MLEKLKNPSKQIYLLWFGVPVLLYQVLISRILSQIFGSLFFVQLFLIAVAYLGTALGSYYALRWKFSLTSSHLSLVGLNIALLAFYKNDASLLAFPGLSLILGFTLFFLISFFSSLLLPLFFEEQKRNQTSSTAIFNRVYFYFHLLVVIALLMVELDLLASWGIYDLLVSLTSVELIWAAYWWLQSRQGHSPLTRPVNFSGEKLRALRPLLLPLFAFSVISGVIQSILYRQVQNILAPLAIHYSLYLAALILSWALASLWFRSANGYKWLEWKNFKAKSAVLLLALLIWSLFWPVAWSAMLDGFHLSTNYGEDLNTWVHRDYLPYWILGIRWVLTFGLVFPFGFFFGSMLPLVQKENDQVPLGVYLSVNSLGNALGILLFISFLFEALDIFQIWSLMALLCLVFAERNGKMKWLTSSSILAMGLIILALTKTYSWDLGSFSMRGFARWYESSHSITAVHTFKHRSSQVNFVEFENNYSRMYMNGHTSVSMPKSEKVPMNDTLMGVTPMAYVNNFGDSLVIGLGTGATALASADLFKQTDIVDLDPTMLQVAGSLKFVADKLLHNPQVKFTEADGLTYLRTTPKKYDLIINNVPSPVYFAAAKLWSREALQAVYERLNDNGIFAQWLDGEISQDSLDSLMQTQKDLFHRCDLIMLNFEFYSLICSKGEAPLQHKGYPPSLATFFNSTPEKLDKFTNALRFPGVAIAPLNEDAPMNTLDQPHMDVLVAQNPPGWLYNSRFDSVAMRYKIPEAVSNYPEFTPTTPEKQERCSLMKGWLRLRTFEPEGGSCAELF